MPKMIMKQPYEVINGPTLEQVLPPGYTFTTFKEVFERGLSGHDAVIVKIVKVFPSLKSESVKKMVVREVFGEESCNVPVNFKVGWADKIDNVIKTEDIAIFINPDLETNPSICRDNAKFMVTLDSFTAKKNETKIMILRGEDGSAFTVTGSIAEINKKVKQCKKLKLGRLETHSSPSKKVCNEGRASTSGMNGIKHLNNSLTYTLIRDLKIGSGFNMFGIVSSLIKPLSATKSGKYHGMLIIADEHSNISPDLKKDIALHIFHPYHCSNFMVEEGDIVRVHHMKTEVFNNKIDGRVFHVNSLSVFHSREGATLQPKSLHNKSEFVLSEFEEKRILELRSYLSSEYKKSTEINIDGSPPWSRIMRLMEISDPGEFNMYCQILNQVQMPSGNVLLRVQDGTFLKVGSREYSIGKTGDEDFSMNTPQYTTNKGYLDIIATGDAASSASNLTTGDYVYLTKVEGVPLKFEDDNFGKPLLEFSVSHKITQVPESHKEAFIIDRNVKKNILDPLSVIVDPPLHDETNGHLDDNSEESMLTEIIDDLIPCEVMASQHNLSSDVLELNNAVLGSTPSKEACCFNNSDTINTSDTFIEPMNSTKLSIQDLFSDSDLSEAKFASPLKSNSMDSVTVSKRNHNHSPSKTKMTKMLDDEQEHQLKIDMVTSYWRYQQRCYKTVVGRKLFVSTANLTSQKNNILSISDIKREPQAKGLIHCQLLAMKPNPPASIRSSFYVVCPQCQVICLQALHQAALPICKKCQASLDPTLILSFHVTDGMDCIGLFASGNTAEKLLGCNWETLQRAPSFGVFLDNVLLKLSLNKHKCWLELYVESHQTKSGKLQYHIMNSELLLDRIMAL